MSIVSRIGRGIIQGLTVTGKHVFKPPVTRHYPETRAYTPDRFRGIHRLVVEDCVVCHACDRVCPVNCITIEGHRGEDRRFVLERFDIDYSVCMFCDLCVEVCPTDCLTMGPEFELAVDSRAQLTYQHPQLEYTPPPDSR